MAFLRIGDQVVNMNDIIRVGPWRDVTIVHSKVYMRVENHSFLSHLTVEEIATLIIDHTDESVQGPSPADLVGIESDDLEPDQPQGRRIRS